MGPSEAYGFCSVMSCSAGSWGRLYALHFFTISAWVYMLIRAESACFGPFAKDASRGSAWHTELFLLFLMSTTGETNEIWVSGDLEDCCSKVPSIKWSYTHDNYCPLSGHSNLLGETVAFLSILLWLFVLCVSAKLEWWPQRALLCRWEDGKKWVRTLFSVSVRTWL